MTERADPDALLEHLRDLDAQTDGPLTWDRMREVGDYHPSTYNNHFDSWADAKQKAGLGDEDDSASSRANTARRPTALTLDAQNFIRSNWRDLEPLLDLDAACADGEGFAKRDLDDDDASTRDLWKATVTVDGLMRKVKRCEDDATRHRWRLTTPARAALEQRVERYEHERDEFGAQTPLPCSCYPLAMSNHGDTIECRHCGEEFRRERCGTTDDGVAADHPAPEADARTDGGERTDSGRDSEHCTTTTTTDPNHNDENTTATDRTD